MTVEYDDNLPPVIRILLSERKHLLSTDFEKSIRRLIPELRRQAKWTLDNFDYEKNLAAKSFGAFATLPAAATDPFTRYGACAGLECRGEAAKTFCRTIGLYADTAILTDHFTAHLSFKQRFSPEDYWRFSSDLMVLWILEPLIKAGIIRFRSPILSFCKVHHQEFENRAVEVARAVLPAFTQDLDVNVIKNNLVITFTGAGGQQLNRALPLTARRRAEIKNSSSLLEYGRAFCHRLLEHDVNIMMFEHMEAIRNKAALLSTSRLHMLAVKEVEREKSDLGHIEVWEDKRSAFLPWINLLSPTEIMQLREEAADALPRFRESVGRVLIDPGREREDDTEEVIHMLREEAAEVKAELAKLKKSGRSVLRNAVGGTLGFTLAFYGLATGAATESSALLLGLLALLHNDSLKEHEQVQKIQTRPGYVLVKAEEMLRHAHD